VTEIRLDLRQFFDCRQAFMDKFAVAIIRRKAEIEMNKIMHAAQLQSADGPKIRPAPVLGVLAIERVLRA
jgi:hypothetical protein